ncbi:STAS domain-containing protein [Streptomyces pratensis]|uniref:STAS domain-containing protein n=1 Tax=Streptomyces pratensis TaxID=1169025 RepID=UPI003019A1B5
MPLLSYRLDESHLVVEVCEVVDLDNEAAVERDLLRLLPCCGPHTVIVDVLTPLLTPRSLGLLLRVRGRAEERGVVLAVVARYGTAREVLRAAGLDRVLRVAATLPGAELRGRGCRPGTGSLPLRERTAQTASGHSPLRTVGPSSDASRPRMPEVRARVSSLSVLRRFQAALRWTRRTGATVPTERA